MIKTVIEQAIKSIEAEKAQKVAVVKEQITREKIVPFNAEIDGARAKALQEVDAEYNQKIAQLRKECEEKKQELVRLGEEKERQNAETVLASELAVVAVEYDNAIAALTKQIEEIKE